MRSLLLAALLPVALLGAPAARAAAQEPAARATPSDIPPAVAREAADVYNADGTVRSLGPYTVDAGDTVRADVAVVDGPAVVNGRIEGRLVVINADLALGAGATVTGDVLVLGGRVAGRDSADLHGDLRLYASRLAYREENDRLVVDDEPPSAVEEWWDRWRARRERSGTRFLVTTGKTYNRVEGLPIMAGPSLRGRYDWGEVNVDALGILRTAEGARWDAGNLGHHARAELRLGVPRGVLLGGELYDVVRPVEDWHLEDDEVGLAAAFFRRDYRDHHDSHGGALFAGVFAGPDAEIRLRFADERWRSRQERDVFSLFRNGGPWRTNPAVDDGRFHVAGATLHLDTRTAELGPWSGWYVVADYERGSGTVATFAPRPAGDPVPAPGSEVTYGRGFLDLRRYNRVAPGSQLNVRAVLGGWLHGDALPLQRRLSVGGPGSLPGYDFRSLVGEADLNQCSRGALPIGLPAQCDRIALLQAEYRSELRFTLGLGDRELGHERWRRSEWVAFVNSGRGWLVSDAPASAAGGARELWVSRGVPSLGSFRTDVGAGVDIGLLGVYVAKSVSHPGEPANVFVRLRERF